MARGGVLRGDAGTECFEQEKPGATHFPYEETEVQRHEVLVTDAGTNWEVRELIPSISNVCNLAKGSLNMILSNSGRL